MPRLGSGLPLIARANELQQLRTALSRAHTGTAGAVLLSGDAGVGKSRLVAEFATLSESEGALVLIGRCLGVGDAGLPYLPFVEVVVQLRARQPDILTDRPALAGLAGPVHQPNTTASADAGGTDLSQLQLFDAVLSALTALSTDRVVLLVIEDIHWADPSTRDLLSFLLSRLSSQRLLIVATYRSDDMHRQHPLRPLLAELVRLPAVERLDLHPFDPAHSREFVQGLLEDGLDNSLDEALVAAIVERSEGNAFFAEELVAAAAAGEAGVPSTLADVLLARVEKLSPAAQRVIGAAAVTSRHQARHASLQAVLGIDNDTLEAALREAVQHNVLVYGDAAPDAYAFRHALVREAVYNDLLPGERSRLHAAYAKLIGEQYDPTLAAALAYHSLHSNDLSTAMTASIQAAHESIKIGALGVGLRHLEQALELWDAVDDAAHRTGTTELNLLRKAGYVASAAGQVERAYAFGKAALELADHHDDLVLRAGVRGQLAQILMANLRWEEAKQVIVEAWELIKDQPASKERALVLEMMARRAISHPEHGDLRSFATAAVADARQSGSPGAEANALITLALADMRAGDLEQGCALLEQARIRAAEGGAPDVELRAIFNLSVTRHEQGLLDLAAAVADDGARRAADLGLTWSPYGLELRWLQAMVHYARGDWDRAAEAAAPPGEQVSDNISALIAASGGLVQAGRGHFAEAQRMLERVRPLWVRDDQIAQLAGVAGAEMACWQGHPEVAVQLIDEALDAIRKATDEEWPMGGIRMATLALAAEADLAQQARQRHDPQAEAAALAKGRRYASFAEQTGERGRPRADTLGPEGRAWLARMRAELSRLLGEHDPAPWREVVEAFGYGEIYPQALARWRLAEALVAHSDRDSAVAELDAALATATKLGAAPLADACRDLARRARLGLPGAAPPVLDTLTPREVSVLRLVAEGRTNRQIGDELFISDKTVSVHVSRVMAKLNAASRTEAVAIAYQRGLLTD